MPSTAIRRLRGEHARRPAPARGLGDLFPLATPSQWPSYILALGYTAGFVALVGLALLRQSGIPATGTLWAEDGVVFYSQAVNYPFWHTLVTAYNGYDQLGPRLGAQLATLGPVRDVPTVVTLAGAIGLAVLGCSVFHMARGHISPAPLRGLLVAAMVLLPVAIVEMLDNLVNLPWWMFFASFWALLWRPRARYGRVAAGTLCALAAASEPLVGLLVPLAAVRAVVLRRADEQAAGIGLMIGLAYQVGVVLTANGEHSFSPSGLAGIPGAFGARVGLGWLSGLRGTDALVASSRALGEILGAVLFVALVVTCLALRGKGSRAFAVTVAVLAPICFAVPSWLRGAAPYMQTAKSVGYAGRYAATPMLMLISAVLVGAGQLARRPAKPGRRRWVGHGRTLWIVGACCALFLPAWVADFRDHNGRTDGPSWQSQLSRAESQCRAQSASSLVRVGIDPPGQGVVLHCRTITGPR